MQMLPYRDEDRYRDKLRKKWQTSCLREKQRQTPSQWASKTSLSLKTFPLIILLSYETGTNIMCT